MGYPCACASVEHACENTACPGLSAALHCKSVRALLCCGQAEGGWTLRDVGTVHPYDSPGLLVPELKRAILALRDQHGVALDAADNLVLDEQERVG